MTKQIITRRQKDVSRLLREKRRVYPDKIKVGKKGRPLWNIDK